MINRARTSIVFLTGVAFALTLTHEQQANADKPKRKWIQSTAYAVPKHTVSDGEGYFAIVEGHNRRLYIGTHKNATNCWLVEFDPATKTMRPVVDAHKAIGTVATGFSAQAKVHTRNNVGKKTGKIYFATKQGYPAPGEPRIVYPGGYPMVYDPATETIKVYPIAVPHQGIISITPDESRGLAYISTCSDSRPIESTHFMVLDLATGKYKDLMDCENSYAFVVVDYRGRAYHPIRGGDIARYDPETKTLERLKQTIDGKPPVAESHLADEYGHPLNWDISPDGKTLFSQPMSTNALYSYDLMQEGGTLDGRFLGPLLPGAKGTDCRAMCVGPSGTAWCAVTEMVDGVNLSHLVRYAPGDKVPIDLGPVAISNPDFTPFHDEKGNGLPFHHGIVKKYGVTTTIRVTLGVCEARDGSVYILAIHPYTLQQISPDQLR